MAASIGPRRELFTLARIISEISLRGSRGFTSCSIYKNPTLHRFLFSLTPSAYIQTASRLSSIPPSITVTEEPDTLFQKVDILVKGHDRAVLDSYETFASMAAKELGITVSKISEPRKDMERFTLLKSVHIFKNHRVQYEMRTHYRRIELSHITGCTTRVFLEYIQRNLPEGVAMEVTKTAMEKIPDHILEPMWKEQPDEKPSI